jgi:hypothetical protein
MPHFPSRTGLLFDGYLPIYLKTFFPSIQPEFTAKVEDKPEEGIDAVTVVPIFITLIYIL